MIRVTITYTSDILSLLFCQGTVWYTQFKWRVVSLFNNLLNFDAMTLGNHEFDDKIAGLEPFLRNQSCPVVVTNMNVSLAPALAGLTVPSVRLEVGNKMVGIVGYITPDTKHISNPEGVTFTDEIEALKTEVKRLHDEGINIIVALGHSGYEKDRVLYFAKIALTYLVMVVAWPGRL